MTKPLVLLDCDGILSDFVGAVIATAEEEGIALDCDLLTTYDLSTWIPPNWKGRIFEKIRAEGFCADMFPVPSAVYSFRALRKVASVHVVTTPWQGLERWEVSEYWQFERTRWLWERFGIEPSQITHTCRKDLLCGDMLIDDDPKAVLAWRAHHIEHVDEFGYLWAAPYNRNEQKDHAVLRSWDELIAEVERRAKA